MPSERLKPCPFCGEAQQIFRHWRGGKYGRVIYFVRCATCGAQTRPFGYSPGESELKGREDEWDNFACDGATAAWNRRARR